MVDKFRVYTLIERIAAGLRVREALVCLACTLGLLTTSASASASLPQLAAGADHSLALRADGQAFAWGDDSLGQLGSARQLVQSAPVAVLVPEPQNVRALAAGAYHSLALTQDGSVFAWGNNGSGELGDGTLSSRGVPLRVLGLPAVSRIAAGEQHSVAVATDGTVWSWGNNADGRLGGGDVQPEVGKFPGKVAGLTQVVDAKAGRAHTVVLTRQGQVFSWGVNYSGQLGDSTGRTRLTAVAVDFPSPVPTIVAIDASGDQSFALDDQGRLWTWGDNAAYQLGESLYAFRTFPLYLDSLFSQGRVISFSVGPSGGAAVLADGSLWLWGFNGRYDAPTKVSALQGLAASVKLGDGYLLVTLTDGRLLAMGDNQHGQLGIGTVVSPNENVLVKPQLAQDAVVAMASGYFHALVLDATGRLWAWGDNTRGQLGDGVATSSTVPQPVVGLPLVSQIAAGQRHALALDLDGGVWAWGDNDEGALGDGTDARLRTAPVRVAGLPPIRRVAAGGSCSAAIDSNGQLWGWGDNFRGQLAISPETYRTSVATAAQGLPSLKDVAVGAQHMLGLDAAGQVWVWGANGYGQLGDGYNQATAPRVLTQLPPILAVAAGGLHSMALDGDGRVWAWGYNEYQQVGTSLDSQVHTPMLVNGLPPIAAIAAGFTHSLALDRSGRMWAWGSGQEGQLGDGDTQIRANPVVVEGDGLVSIAAGYLHSLAVRRDGLVLGLGLNYSGQLGDGSFVDQSRYAVAVDRNLRQFFDLLPAVANEPLPVGSPPPVFAQTQKRGNDRRLTLNAKLGLPSGVASGSGTPVSRAAVPGYELYVAALVPGAVTGVPLAPPSVWLRSRAGQWGQYLGGPLAAYLSNVSVSDGQSLLVDILESTDLSTMVGTRFYIGYGTSSDEMLASGRIRLLYEVQGER